MMDIDNLKDLMGRVTPGPWYAERWYVRTSAANHYWQIADAGPAGRHVDYCSDNATFIAMAPDLAAEVIRLTTEHAQLVADNQALVMENARLVKRDQEARRIIEDADLCGGDIDRPAARSFLAGEGK